MAAPARRSPRNSVQDRPHKWRLILRKQKRLLRPALWLAGACVVVSIGAFVVNATMPGGTLITMQERIGEAVAGAGLRVETVIVEGRNNTPEPLLRAAIGINKGDPILGFTLEATRARIASLNWIEHATVERRLPSTVVVVLQERRPFAIWQNDGKFTLIDRDGKMVDNQDVAQFRYLPLVVGRGAPARAAALLDALANRPGLAARVVAAVRVGERRWNLRLINGADVMLPEGKEIEAMDRLLTLHRDHALLDRALAAIDMRLPDKLVLRAKAEPRADSVPPPPAPKKPT